MPHLLPCNPPSLPSAPRWIKETTELKKLEKYASDPKFQEEWRKVKQQAKAKLAALIKDTYGQDVNQAALFDIQVGALR
jgi:starch phosphorylase